MPPGGCIADYEATADLIGRMKKGQVLTVQAIHMNGQAMSPQLDCSDFAKAYDGPPTDPKVFEEQQKKLQEELQKRAEEARKKLESQPPQAAAPAHRRRADDTVSTKSKGPPRGGPFVLHEAARVSVQHRIARPVTAVVVALEHLGDLRMPDRLAGRVGQQVLLRHIGDVFVLRVLGEQMIERLVLAAAARSRGSTATIPRCC